MRHSHLDPCPLCGSEARIVDHKSFHLSYAYEDQSLDKEVTEFHHSYAVICTGCDLNLPSIDVSSEEELEILTEAWNDRYT